MFKIINKEKLAEDVYKIDIYAPRIASASKPGQFIIVKADEIGERIPLTIADYNEDDGSVSIVIQSIGKSTRKLVNYNIDDCYKDVVGPLGKESKFVNDIESYKNKNILFIAGGIGTAPVYPQVKYLHEMGINADVIIGARNKDFIIMEDEIKEVTKNLYISTDDGSRGFNGNVTMLLDDLVKNQNKKYDLVIAIGPMVMMKYVCILTKKLGIKTIVSMNPIMVDGTGMCGACRITVGDGIKFACVDGPEFDGHLINFDEAMSRQELYKTEEGREKLIKETKEPQHSEDCTYPHDLIEDFDKRKRVSMKVQNPLVRKNNFDEVSLGYDLAEAKLEASRCLQCKKPKCVLSCPVEIDIPAFIKEVEEGNIEKAANIIYKSSNLPSICGRVCPQEEQCEGVCIVGIKNEPVAIGRLERFVGDYGLKNKITPKIEVVKNNKKVAIIGAGPAGLACSADLAKLGYDVTIFEALHEVGGVLTYGIPEFRLPKDSIVLKEIENIINLGVKIETNVVVGRTITIDKIFEEGYKAVFLGTGAGLPRFMGIEGENANGVFSANEYLTRSNLMKAFKKEYETPIAIGKKVAVVGGGNVAMDAARTALRLGSQVHIVYRRSEKELPARIEEVHHAKEEGIIFNLLTNPVKILTNENGWVKGMECIQMELGEEDSSGRRRPIPKENSNFVLDVDTVLMALGTSPNPLIKETTLGIEVDKYGCFIVDENLGTTKTGVFAGGDAVTGAATVILAMGAGKSAAKSIHNMLSK